MVGFPVGAAVGDLVGDFVGSKVGLEVGDGLGRANAPQYPQVPLQVEVTKAFRQRKSILLGSFFTKLQLFTAPFLNWNFIFESQHKKRSQALQVTGQCVTTSFRAHLVSVSSLATHAHNL